MNKFTALAQLLNVNSGVHYIVWSNDHCVPLKIPCDKFTMKDLKKYGILDRESYKEMSDIKQMCKNSTIITEEQWDWVKSVKSDLLIKFNPTFGQNLNQKHVGQCRVVEIIRNTFMGKKLNSVLIELRTVLFSVQLR